MHKGGHKTSIVMNYLFQEATGGVDIILEMLADVNLAMDCQLCKYHGKIAVSRLRLSYLCIV